MNRFTISVSSKLDHEVKGTKDLMGDCFWEIYDVIFGVLRFFVCII